MILSVVILISFVLFLFLKKSICDTLSRYIILIYLLYWSFLLILSTFNPLGLYDVSSETYILLILNVVSFILGFTLFPLNRHLKNVPSLNLNISNYLASFLKNTRFRLLFIIALILGILLVIRQWTLLYFYSTGNIKTDILNLLFQGNRVFYYVYDLILTPFYYFLMTVFVMLLFYYKKKEWLFLTLLLILVYSFIGASRGSFKTIIYFIFIAYALNRYFVVIDTNVRPLNLKFNHIFKFSLIIVSIFFLMVFITALNEGVTALNISSIYDSMSALLGQFITYSLGPFRALDYSLNNPDFFFNDDWYLGRSSFSGLDYLISLIASSIGCKFEAINYLTLNKLQLNSIMVGKDIPFNFAYTEVIYYYWDFRTIGVILIPFIKGFILRYFIYRLYKRTNIFNISLICFCFVAMMYSYFSNFFIFTYTVPYIVFLFLLGNKQSLKHA